MFASLTCYIGGGMLLTVPERSGMYLSELFLEAHAKLTQETP